MTKSGTRSEQYSNSSSIYTMIMVMEIKFSQEISNVRCGEVYDLLLDRQCMQDAVELTKIDEM